MPRTDWKCRTERSRRWHHIDFFGNRGYCRADVNKLGMVVDVSHCGDRTTLMPLKYPKARADHVTPTLPRPSFPTLPPPRPTPDLQDGWNESRKMANGCVDGGITGVRSVRQGSTSPDHRSKRPQSVF